MPKQPPHPSPDRFARLRRGVLHGKGHLSPNLRRAAFAGGPLPTSLEGYVEKVRVSAYKVTDTDVKRMRDAGWSEEEIFELTVATALGAALSRYDRARAALAEAS